MINIRIDCNCFNAHFLTGFDYPTGYFSTIGNKYFFKHLNCCLQGNVVVFTPGVFLFFVIQHFEGMTQFPTCFVWQENVVDITTACRYKRVGKLSSVFVGSFFDFLLIANIFFEYDFHSTFRAHNRNLCRRPSKIYIPSNMF